MPCLILKHLCAYNLLFMLFAWSLKAFGTCDPLPSEPQVLNPFICTCSRQAKDFIHGCHLWTLLISPPKIFYLWTLAVPFSLYFLVFLTPPLTACFFLFFPILPCLACFPPPLSPAVSLPPSFLPVCSPLPSPSPLPFLSLLLYSTLLHIY